MFKECLLVGLGSALGGVLRFAMIQLGARLFSGTVLPVGTWMANILGSFLIGWCAAWLSQAPRALEYPWISPLIMVGVLGGFTTFSSFSLQTLALAREGSLGAAALNVVVSLFACLTAVWTGYRLGST